jgi:hypothetical protein
MRCNNAVDNLSLLLQVIDLEILLKDYNNKDLMREFQHQNKDYLETIIDQNKEIIRLLKEGK